MKKNGGFDWLTIIQFLFSVTIVLLTLMTALIGFLIIFTGDQLAPVAIPQEQVISSYLLLAGTGFIGLLLVPSAISAGRTLLGKEQRDFQFLDNAWWLFFLIPLLIFGTVILPGDNSLQVAAFILIHLITNGAIAFWMIYLIRRRLPKGSSQKFWGIFGSGLTFAPLVALVVELVLLGLIVLVWIAYLQTRPELLDEITSLVNRLPQSAVSPPILERLAGKYLSRPGVLGTIFVYIAVLIPVVEELIKPIGIWLLLSRKLSPWEGFVLGGLGGAGYALFENLTVGANADVWTLVVISRIGTTSVHIFTSGLVGWGLVSAWSEDKYLRLGLAYLSAVLMHGAWNGFNVVNLIDTIPGLGDGMGSFITNFASYAPIGLIVLSLGALGGIIYFNNSFRRAIMTQVNQTK